MGVSGFLSRQDGEMKLKEYEIIILPMNSSKQNHKVKVLCVPNICSKIKGQNLSCVIKNDDFIRQLHLADTSFNSEANVDILIGVVLYWQSVTGETKRSEKCNLVAINSIFGWVVSGPNEYVNGNHNSTVCTSTVHVLKISCNENEMLKLNENIHRFWNLDEIEITENELSVYDKFKNDIKLVDQRYSVKLRIKEYHPMLPDNYSLSLKRLQSLRIRLANDEVLLRKYDQIFQDQLNEGITEEVSTEVSIGNITYLPHKEVVKNERSTTNLRIVFDASAKLRSAVSLNDILYTGPCLNPELYKLLLQFRLQPIAITADIEKAYLQINVEKEDRDYFRFLWFKNLFTSRETMLCKYRFTRVIFGATCSQFLLNATVNNHIAKYVNIDPDFVKSVRDLNFK